MKNQHGDYTWRGNLAVSSHQFDLKINQHFQGLVVRKDLVKTVKGNAIVPSYVLEYLLGQYCATSDEATIEQGIDTVKEILRQHYVHRNEAGLVRSNIKEKGRYKVIDRIQVALNEKADVYEATFANLGIKKVLVDSTTVKKHPKLLVSGVWCIADVEYEFTENKNACPWILSSLKPIQLSHFDFDGYVEARQNFSTEEWIDLLMQSIGFNPELFGKRSKLTQLIRLIPFCERNYNLIELGPKGTGKSHIFSEFSPHGILISGGEVTVAKLFVNNSSGKIGLVGYWDVVAFDEFAGQQKRVNKALVDIMKNYMANKSFSRGVETLGAEASMVFVGNTKHNVPYMLKHSDLFEELPDKFHDSAFLDRIHFYIPGWEVDIIRGEMFSSNYGFVVDYLAEILRSMRNYDYSDRYQNHFTLSSDISTRDRDAIHKTFSGLMKILFPNGRATKQETEELLRFSMEGRKRVKDQLFRIDSTYAEVNFAYDDNEGISQAITTLEEEEYPAYYYQKLENPDSEATSKTVEESESSSIDREKEQTTSVLKEQHLVYQENQRGVSFDSLFAPYLKNAKKIVVTDPYIRLFHPLKTNPKGEPKLYGYAIAIPDIRHLTAFCQHFPSILQRRKIKEQWGKPHSAIVRNLEEAGLDSLGSIYTYISKLKPELNIDELLFGVDVFHIVRPQDKPQSKPQIMSIQRYPPDREAIAEFTRLQYKLFNPLFRQQYWQNLTRNCPRIEGFYNLLRDLPTDKTIKNNSFCQDFRTVFSPKSNSMEQEESDRITFKETKEPDKTTQSNKTPKISIENLLLRLLKTYTRHQLEHRFKLKWNQKWDNQKSEDLKKIEAYWNYKEKRKQIVVDLHHDFRRPRQSHEFLAYFAAKFTDIYQYITTEEYLLVAKMIQTEPEQIRILCLLALPVL